MRNEVLSFFFRPRAAKLGVGTAWPWGPGPMGDFGTLGSLGSCMPGSQGSCEAHAKTGMFPAHTEVPVPGPARPL